MALIDKYTNDEFTDFVKKFFFLSRISKKNWI